MYSKLYFLYNQIYFQNNNTRALGEYKPLPGPKSQKLPFTGQ